MEVTARKWRPGDFDAFVGQEPVIQSLKNALREKRFAHAYLFSGPRGVGKTSAARVFAKAVNCLTHGPSDHPCGSCKNCVEIAAGSSVDVIEVDGASNRGIEQIRELRDNIQYLPSQSPYKVYIIDEVHMLTDAAFNALLKTLEEPPSHVIFLLATTEPHKVKITIRSRCQHFRLKRLSLEQIADQLKKILESRKVSFEEEALRYLAKAADGSMRDSQSLLDQSLIYCGTEPLSLKRVQEILGSLSEEKLISFLEILIAQDVSSMAEMVQSLYEEGEDIGFFVEGLIQQFRYLLLAKNGISNFEALDERYYHRLKELSQSFTEFQIHRLIEIFLDLHKELKFTDKEKFVVENVFFQALDYENFVHLKNLVKKIEEIEKALLSQGDFALEKSVPEKTPEKVRQTRKIQNTEKKEFPAKEKTLLISEEPEKEEKSFVPEEPKDSMPLNADQIWKEFKAKVAERSPKLAAAFQDVRKIELSEGILKLEFFSVFPEEQLRHDRQLISQIIQFFGKFNIKLKSVETFVSRAEITGVKNPVEYLKENFEGEEI